jgi:ubiquinone/menaquinone biosynthesis C-methylase UbiE
MISRVREEFARQAETLSVAKAFTNVEVLDRIRAAVAPTKTSAILDVGCGPGILAAALAPHAREVMAFDLTPEMLAKARKRCGGAGLLNVRVALGRAEELPFPDGCFDAVVSRVTLHHVPDPQRALGEMARVTRPHGRIVLADVVASEVAEDAELHNAIEVLRDPSHVRMLALGEIQRLIEAAGLRPAALSTWDMAREFDEWIGITNAPERAAPLRTILRTLARAGIQAGIDLRHDGHTALFTHHWMLITAEKIE